MIGLNWTMCSSSLWVGWLDRNVKAQVWRIEGGQWLARRTGLTKAGTFESAERAMEAIDSWLPRMTNADLIAEARALAEKSTPGPWAWSHVGGVETLIGNSGKNSVLFAVPTFRREDAAFITVSRSLVPSLCDALEAALARVAEGEADYDALLVKYDDALHRADFACEQLVAAERVIAAARTVIEPWKKWSAAGLAAAVRATEAALTAYDAAYPKKETK